MLRAVGKIQRDQLFGMTCCGIDAYQLMDGADFNVALTAFDDYTVEHQPGVDVGVQLKRRAS